jgi:flagellin
MVNNLQVGVENLTASESRIRDADMALEMVSFTKSQILLQAGTAMLAQANNVPQSVLRLMQ